MKTVYITEYGARTGDALSTDAIQRAIDDCFLAGGGEVIVPAGIFRTGDVRVRSCVTLHLLSGAMLEGSENPDDYGHFNADKLEPSPAPNEAVPRSADPASRWNHGLLRAYRAHDIAVIGEPYSYIDGRNVFDPLGEENYRGPHAINFWDCENVTFAGYTLRNSANWAHAVFRSKNVSFRGVTVLGGHDGIDVFLCDGVSITSCNLLSGDDSLAGFGSKNVHMHDCVLDSSCSSMRFGGTDVLVERCSGRGPAPFSFRGSMTKEEKSRGASTTEAHRSSLLSGFLYYCDNRFGELPHRPGNIVVRDCEFINPRELFSHDFGSQHVWCCGEPLGSITFENCRALGVRKPIIVRTETARRLDLTLRNVTLSPRADGEQSVFLDASGCVGITLDNVSLEGYNEPEMRLGDSLEPVVTGSSPFKTVLRAVNS